MSPEQSSKRASIYEKLALKDKLESNKQRQSLLLLSDELKKNRQIETQLSSLIEQNNNEVGAKTGMTLQTASWFNTKVRDQLELVQNRCQHLEIEIGEMRKKLAYAERKRVRKIEKAEALHKQVRQTRQDKQDAALSERGRRPRIR
jgi:hypothetical protein